MLDVLGEVLGNAHFEAYVGGPVAGVLFACIFSALGTRPIEGSAQEQSSPQESRERIKNWSRSPDNVKEVHHHHYHQTGTGSSDGASSVFLAGACLLVLSLFLFAVFLPQIAGAFYFFVTAVATFSMTASVLAILTGQFNTSQWYMYSIFPFAVSIGCFWLTTIAHQAISPDVIAYAQSLLGNGSMNVGVIANGAFKFFRAISNDYTQWMMFEMVAFICISMCALIAFLQCVYYVSLSNTRRAGSSSMWRALVLLTSRFSGIWTTIYVAILFGAGWFLAAGGAYRLVH